MMVFLRCLENIIVLFSNFMVTCNEELTADELFPDKLFSIELTGDELENDKLTTCLLVHRH